MVVHAPHLGPRPRRAAPVQPAPARPSQPEPDRHWIDRAIASTPQWVRGLAGNTLWGALHKRALKVAPGQRDDAWLAVFRQILPCGDCRKHWDAMLEATPPPAAPDLFAWTVARHNEVNRRLGKPEMGLEEALKRWSGSS